MPTPKSNRLPVITATVVACFATSTGCRMGSLTTNVAKRSVVVTAPSAGIIANGSRNGLSSRNSRVPSALYGYRESASAG